MAMRLRRIPMENRTFRLLGFPLWSFLDDSSLGLRRN
jgi:hypothetical protein